MAQVPLHAAEVLVAKASGARAWRAKGDNSVVCVDRGRERQQRSIGSRREHKWPIAHGDHLRPLGLPACPIYRRYLGGERWQFLIRSDKRIFGLRPHIRLMRRLNF